ncbi:MAG: ATP synthase F1 subunit delta [Halanaerobacter sp.]
MIEQEIAEKYAEALFELVTEENELEDIAAEFADVIEIAQENKELNQVLNHPKLNYEQKKEIVAEIFKGQISTDLFNFLKLLIDKNRIEFLDEIYQEFNSLVEDRENKLEVKVTAPLELSTAQKKSLKKKLGNILDKDITLELEIEPDLIGGLILKIGDKVIDGSIRNYLHEMELDLQTLEVS